MERARGGYWQALERADRYGALAVVRSLRAGAGPGAPGPLGPLEVVADLVLPTQRRIGELWERGEWGIEQERAATAVNEAVVHHLCAGLQAPGPDRPLVVVATLVGEQHALPALVVAAGLTDAGIQVNHLGGDPDPAALIEQVLALKPRAVVLSGSLTSVLARQRRLLGTLAAIGTPVLVGGSAFGHDERRALALGVTAYAADVATLVALVEALPERSASRAVEPASPAEVEADWLLEHQGDLTAYVVSGLAARRGEPAAAAGHGWWDVLAAQVGHVVGCLASTLVTDDETIMVEVARWLERVLVARGAPETLVDDLWDVLAEALRGHPLARLHLAGAAPVATRAVVVEPAPPVAADRTVAQARRVVHGSDDELGASA